MSEVALAARACPANPNHHLWNNNGTWWLHYTVHRPDFTKQRMRTSLRTRCLTHARRLRDAVLRSMAISAGKQADRLGKE